MFAVKRHSLPILLVFVLAPLMFSCGESQKRETVFMYIVNGYPGSASLTLYGPTGTLVEDLAFGDKTPNPVEIDRNVNSTDFTLVIDGAPTAIDFQKNLFDLYPQETGTMFVKRRSGEQAATTQLFRHVTTPDPDCLLTMANGLSLTNSYNIDDEFLTYSFQTEWNIPPRGDGTFPHSPNLIDYVEEDEELVQTRCGEVANPYPRPEAHEAIRNDPWFFAVDAPDQEGYFVLVWGRRVLLSNGETWSDGLTIGGQIDAVPTTTDYMECLESAITVKTEDEGGGGGGSPIPTGDQQECPDPEGPDGQLSRDQITINEAAALKCDDIQKYSGMPVEPGGDDTNTSFLFPPNADGTCGFPMRVRTAGMDIIHQGPDNGLELVQADVTFPTSDQHFFVLYGRPIDPFIEQWTSSETTVSLTHSDYPYPGAIEPAGSGQGGASNSGGDDSGGGGNNTGGDDSGGNTNGGTNEGG